MIPRFQSGSILSRHGDGMEKKLRPEFAQPPESVQRFMQLPVGIGRDVWILPPKTSITFWGSSNNPADSASHNIQRSAIFDNPLSASA